MCSGLRLARASRSRLGGCRRVRQDGGGGAVTGLRACRRRGRADEGMPNQGPQGVLDDLPRSQGR